MGLFDSKKENKKGTKTMTMSRVEVFCCQCHQKLNDIYTKPEDKESFLDNFVMCPTCFIEFCEKYRKEN